MGVRLVAEFLNPYWGKRLNSTDRLVAITMAMTALDPGHNKSPEETQAYFAGVDYLAAVVSGETNGVASDSALRLVRRSLRRLEQAGAIAVVSRGYGHRRSAWRITPNELQMQTGPVDNTAKPVDKLVDAAA